MTLNYKILWFEDEQGWYESILPDFKEFLVNKGFILLSYREEGSNNLDVIINKRDFDLILIDYGLVNEETGDTIIEKIRRHEIYTDIIFYSQNGENVVRKKMQEIGLDGVFCATRDRNFFIPKVKKVINSTLKKVEDLNNIRGLVMAETSELDVKMEEIILMIYEKAKVEDQEKIKNKICKEFIESSESYIKKAVSLQETNKIEKLVQLINATQKWRTVKRLCRQTEKLGVYQKNIESYDEEILKKRNLLAHVREVTDAAGNIELKSSIPGYPVYNFNDEEAQAIRINILKYTDILSDLLTVSNKL